jgi:hypothetical protein
LYVRAELVMRAGMSADCYGHVIGVSPQTAKLAHKKGRNRSLNSILSREIVMTTELVSLGSDTFAAAGK